MKLCNTLSKEELKERLSRESFERTTLSFYRYVIIDDPRAFRDALFVEWSELGILGRTYIAKEGINAQISVPSHHFEKFKSQLYSHPEFKDIPFKIAIEDDGKSFYKLILKVKNKIVADGLEDGEFDVTNVGTHLTAEEFNLHLEDPQTICVDMRNHYESELGHFEKALCPDSDTFREEIQMVTEELQDKKNTKILLYCTGGIRCEKASAYLRHKGFKDVNQLHGGIIEYARQVQSKGIPCKFKGKNFVFDDRKAESISHEILSHCHQCGEKCDTHTNCANDACHLLFIQCSTCAEKLEGTCSLACQGILHLPFEKQKELRRQAKQKADQMSVYKSRLRPRLS